MSASQSRETVEDLVTVCFFDLSIAVQIEEQKRWISF